MYLKSKDMTHTNEIVSLLVLCPVFTGISKPTMMNENTQELYQKHLDSYLVSASDATSFSFPLNWDHSLAHEMNFFQLISVKYVIFSLVFTICIVHNAMIIQSKRVNTWKM